MTIKTIREAQMSNLLEKPKEWSQILCLIHQIMDRKKFTINQVAERAEERFGLKKRNTYKILNGEYKDPTFRYGVQIIWTVQEMAKKDQRKKNTKRENKNE